jgi:hypothetical protein
MINELTGMLKHKRPAYSKQDEIFIEQYIAPVNVFDDDAGNLIKIIGDDPEVMWSCHTDTVHMTSGYQEVRVKGQYIGVNDKNSNCLGADDTAGVWLMLELIRAGKEGLYVFHRAEEIGGKGSSFIARNTPDLLKNIKCVIALDRKGTRDVITHQGTRCCSDTFAKSLADALDMKFELSDRGLFTDSANYTDIVGECTNLSVGYENAHSDKEILDMAFLQNMRNKLVTLDYSKLVYDRKAGDIDPDDLWHKPFNYNSIYGTSDSYTDEIYKPITLIDFAYEYPEVVAKVLKDYGISVDQMREEVFNETNELV